jgi:uncharacterized SAM-binding protein YcdF (DUF218 family)
MRGLAIAGLGACLLFAAEAGRLLVADSPQRSDVILVLAGETDHRPARAIELLEQGYGRRVIIDVPAEARMYGFTDLELAQQYVQRLVTPAAVSICPISGLSTRDEAHDAARCLAREEGSRILIVTSDYHTRRALDIFRHEVRGKSFTIAAAYNPEEFGARWWNHRQWAKTCLQEWTKLVWWTVIDRWR